MHDRRSAATASRFAPTGLAHSYCMTMTGVSMLLSANRTLAQFLRSEMDRRGIVSTYDLATFIGVSQGTAWRLLDGRRVPREETLTRISKAFDVALVHVRDMAERPTGEPETFRVPPEFNQLTSRERDAVIEVGWCLLAARAERRVTR